MKIDWRSVCRLHGDLAREYMGGFEESLEEMMLKYTSTGGYDSQANPEVEGRIRLVFEVARALLLQASAPDELWPPAAEHANELLNRRRLGGRDPPLFQEFRLCGPGYS